MRSGRMKNTKAVVRCVASALFAVVSLEVQAGNAWTGGGGSTNWSDNNNWGGAAPGYGTLTFTTGGTQGTTSNNNSISAMNQLLWTGSLAWTLNGSTTLSLFDNGGTQAKVENQSSGLVTINAPITFAANNPSPPNPFGEINAVNGDIAFASGALTVNGSSVNGIKLFGAGRTTTFNNTVSASGKWFGLTGANTTMAIGGAFTSGDIYVMNSGTLKVSSGATISTSALRLGGDFGNTGNQNQTLGGTLQFTNAAGGQSFGSVINTVSGNSSNALVIDSTNSSGTNTISGNIFLDSNLRMNQASGGVLSITNATLDLKANTLSLRGNGGNINITGVIGNSSGSGQLVVGSDGTAGGPTVTLSNANTYNGQTFVRAGVLAFTSAGSIANSTIRLGSSSGTSVDASINLTTTTGGTTISSTINPVTTSGSGALAMNSQNTSGTNTYSGHFGLDRNLTITQSAGGTLNITQAHTDGGANLTGDDIKGFTQTFTPAATGTINVSGDIYNSTGNGVVTMNGAGVLVLGGNNTYSGATNVSAGRLLITGTKSGAGAITVSGDAMLGGKSNDATGNSVAGDVTLSSSSTAKLTGGDAGTAGKFNGSGNFTLNAGTTLRVDLGAPTTAGVTFDQIVLTGSSKTMNLGGANLSINIIGAIAANQAYRIVNATSGGNAVTNSFLGVIQNQIYTLAGTGNQVKYKVDYGSNYVDLTFTAVPEPATFSVLGGLICVAVLRRPRRAE